jgi:hypothetical protein
MTKVKINLLGSKKFTRKVGPSLARKLNGINEYCSDEGSQIIQLFGRGVQLKGYNFSFKTSDKLDRYKKN